MSSKYKLTSILILSAALIIISSRPVFAVLEPLMSPTETEGNLTPEERQAIQQSLNKTPGQATIQKTANASSQGGGQDFIGWARWLYPFGLSVAAILAVFMLVLAGIQMVAAAGNTAMIESAKGKIWAAVFGLLIAAGSYLILRTINPDLINLELNLKELQIKQEFQTSFPTPTFENTEKITGTTGQALNTGIDACKAGGGTPATSAGGFLCAGKDIDKQRINHSVDENNCRQAGGTVQRNIQFQGGGGGNFCSKEYK